MAAAEAALLAEKGHDVSRYTVSNRDITGLGQIVVTAWQAPYSRPSRARVAEAIAAFGPDVVHVHNFFPILSPSVYDACREAAVPVVQTLHNYRLICPQAMLLRNGAPCEICVTGSPYNAVLYACYRNSRIDSLVAARMVERNRRRGTWDAMAGLFIALTEFARHKLIEGGVPADKIVVKPNFAADPGGGDAGAPRQGALYVGRLSHEKGIATMLEAWKGLEVPLRIVGDGPMAGDVRAAANPAVEMLGRLPREDVAAEMKRAAFMVMPSEWYEGHPMVQVEAFANGLPLVASRLGALAELVEDGGTGLHFEAGNPSELAAKARWATDNPAEMRRMGEAARRAYEANFTPDVNYRQILAIYDRARAAMN